MILWLLIFQSGLLQSLALTREPRLELILAVSEGMPYSIQFISIVESAAKKYGLKLTIERPFALRHYPTLFFKRNGILQKRNIPGYQTIHELETHLQNELTRE